MFAAPSSRGRERGESSRPMLAQQSLRGRGGAPPANRGGGAQTFNGPHVAAPVWKQELPPRFQQQKESQSFQKQRKFVQCPTYKITVYVLNNALAVSVYC